MTIARDLGRAGRTLLLHDPPRPDRASTRHVAAAFVALAQAGRTTAHVMTVDGGNIEAALR